MESRIHLIDQLIDSLSLKLGSDSQKLLPMGGIFDLFLSTEASSMESDPIPFDPHIEMVRIGEDVTGPVTVIGGNGIAIGLKLDEAGLTDRGRDNPIRAIGNGWKGPELFFLKASRGDFCVDRWMR